MLYLAEVQKQKSGFGLGGGRAELKLLACQRGENNWVAVTGDEVIPADDANNFKDGALVIVDLSNSKQVQRIQDAARQLVSILQDFSRLQDKFKTQQEEIEQWKESLTYQSQELNRREMEMEAQREQFEQLEEELERLDQQRQDIESAQENSEKLKAELDQARTEIEQTREQLTQQMQELEEKQATLTSATALSDEQSQQIRGILDQISASVGVGSLQAQLQQALEKVAAGHSALQEHWQQLQEKQAAAEHLQQQVDGSRQDLQTQWQFWQQALETLAEERLQLKSQQNLLHLKQEQAQSWREQLQTQQTLWGQLEKLAAQSQDESSVHVKIDVSALEQMPIEQLQAEVQNLQQEWDRWFRMVNEQEEELKYKQEEIEELQQKMGRATEAERAGLNSDLADERDAYEMLNRTIGGQRRTLREREAILMQHQAILLQRQGLPPQTNPNGSVSFEMVLLNLKSQQESQQEELQRLENEIEQLQVTVQQQEEAVNDQASNQEQKHRELEAAEQSWLEQHQAVALLWGRVNLYQEMLQPVQDRWEELRQQIETTSNELNQLTQASQHQSQQLQHLRELLSSLAEA